MANQILDNRFRVEDPIAKSVSGGVFKGTDLSNNETVAIKLLYMPPHADENYGARFKREANVLFEISHPNVVRIIDAGVTNEGVMYYAMEFVNGVTLDRVINAKGRLTFKEAANLLDQLGSALDALHARSIVHRDVTPTNIMIETLPNGSERLKLVDFGFAKDLGMGSSGNGGPATGRLMLGVAAFLSPEVLAGKTATPLADVHALGVVATIMLTGKHPFQRDSEVGTIGAVLEEQPPSFQELCPEATFPPGLEDAVRKALAKKPNHRTPSAGELARNVRSVLASSGIASPLANGDQSPSFVRTKAQLRPPADKDRMRPPSSPGIPLPPPAPSFAKHAVAAASRPPSFSGSSAALAAPSSRKPAINTSAWFVPILVTVAVCGLIYALMNAFAL